MADLLTELTCAIKGHDWPEWEPSIRFAGHPTESRYCRRCDLWGSGSRRRTATNGAMRKWHAEFGRGPWGRGWLGLRPHVVPNVGGGRSFGWWQIHVWWTHNDGSTDG